MTFPMVDRSNFTPNYDGQVGDDMTDIGWAAGTLRDGRPYHLECWALAGSTGVSVFMAESGLEEYGPLDVNRLLEESGLITNHDSQELSLLRFVDPAGTPCLSISYVVVDDEDDVFADVNAALTGYERNAE